MSDGRKNQQGRGPEHRETRALKALRRLPPASAPVEARTRALDAFLAGAQPAAPDPAASPPAATQLSRRPFLLGTMGLVAAILAVIIIGRTPTEQWVVLDLVNPAGISAPAGSSLQVGDQLDSGTLTTAEGSEIELQLGQRFRFRVLAGTSLELPAAPGRWFGRHRQMQLTGGEIYGTTGGSPLGFPLQFVTDELTASLTGTTFAVFRTPEASCVCLWEGGITVVANQPGVDPIALPELRRVWVYRDGRAPEVLPLSDMETMKLQMTEDAGLAEDPE